MGKGGTSSSYADPAYDYLRTRHTTLLDAVSNTVAGVLASNPYQTGGTTKTVPEPDTDIAATQARLDTYTTLVDAIDVDADWEVLVDSAVAKTDEQLLPDSYVEAAVDKFERELSLPYARMANRIASGMADINSVNSTAFVWGMALLEQDRFGKVANFNAALRLQLDRERTQFIAAGVREMTDLLRLSFLENRAASQLQLDVNRAKLIALNEEFRDQLEVGALHYTWSLETYKYSADAISALAGGASMTGAVRPSKVQSAIGGAFGGASMGAQTGAMVGGPLGAGIGAGVGALAGAIMGAG
jgi:hypothetical protein